MNSEFSIKENPLLLQEVSYTGFSLSFTASKYLYYEGQLFALLI